MNGNTLFWDNSVEILSLDRNYFLRLISPRADEDATIFLIQGPSAVDLEIVCYTNLDVEMSAGIYNLIRLAINEHGCLPKRNLISAIKKIVKAVEIVARISAQSPEVDAFII
jgi:hypothetical protein